MSSNKTLATGQLRNTTPPVFDVARANQALVLVRRIVADIVARYRELSGLRARQRALASVTAEGATVTGSDWEDVELQQQIDQCTEVLALLHRELLDVGCVLKDWRTGLVDFPALRDGRRVWLCWRLGEAEVCHWHELHDGFAGRKPIDDQMGR